MDTGGTGWTGSGPISDFILKELFHPKLKNKQGKLSNNFMRKDIRVRNKKMRGKISLKILKIQNTFKKSLVTCSGTNCGKLEGGLNSFL